MGLGSPPSLELGSFLLSYQDLVRAPHGASGASTKLERKKEWRPVCVFREVLSEFVYEIQG